MPDAQRLRPHPEGRFAAPVHHIDVPAAVTALRAEPHAAIDGHRQIALFRRGPLTLLMFAFDAGALLKAHQTDSVVVIQALSGQLRVTAADATYDLPAGHLVALAPGVPHAVHAPVASTMLLSVCKDDAGAAQ